mgnify:CR=1 FL=1
MKVDDTPYGGGAGMVLTCQPIFDCVKNLRSDDSIVILMTPDGEVYKQKKAYELALKEIEKTEIDENREILYVDLTGEIYLVNDEFSNQNIERELGKMGVQTRRTLTVSSFLKEQNMWKLYLEVDGTLPGGHSGHQDDRLPQLLCASAL